MAPGADGANGQAPTSSAAAAASTAAATAVGDNGNGAAVPPKPSSASAAPRVGGFKLKFKLPPRQDGGAVGGGGGAAPSGTATTPMARGADPETATTTATTIASLLPLKRPADGPPDNAGASSSAAAPPNRLKITLKGIKLGAHKTATPQGPATLPSLDGGPVPDAAAGPVRPTSGGASGGGGKPKRARPSSARSSRPRAPAPPPPSLAPAPPPAAGGYEADVPWADEEDAAAGGGGDGGGGASTTVTTTSTARPPLSSPAPPPRAAADAAAASASAEAGEEAPVMAKPRRRRSKSASPPPSSSASAKKREEASAAAATAEEGGANGGGASGGGASGGGASGGGASGVGNGDASAAADERRHSGDRSAAASRQDADERGAVGELHPGHPLPALHPTRSSTREPVVRVSDCADPSIPDAPFPRDNPLAVVSLVDKVAKRDKEGVFREVPTDYEAPGYSRLVSRPIALSTIRATAASGGYGSWTELCTDLDDMLDNCRAYNGPDSPWGLYADAVQVAAARMLQLTRAGVTDLRGKTGNLFSLQQYQQQQQQREREQRERELRETEGGFPGEGGEEAFASGGGVSRYLRDPVGAGGATAVPPTSSSFAGARAARAGAGGSGRAGGGLLRSIRADAEAHRDGLPRRLDDSGNVLEWRFQNKRASYPARIGGLGSGGGTASAGGADASDAVLALASAVGSLARGHNADGHALLGVLALLPCYVGAPPADAYARSVARFAAGLKGKARERALRAAAASLPSAGRDGRGRGGATGCASQQQRPSPVAAAAPDSSAMPPPV